MRTHSPISALPARRNINVSKGTNTETIHLLFRQFPELSMLPVTENGSLKGVIYRHDFMQTFLFRDTAYLTAEDFTDNNVIYLSSTNTIAEAAEIFETGVFDSIPIVNEQNKFVGILEKDDLFQLVPMSGLNRQTAAYQ